MLCTRPRRARTQREAGDGAPRRHRAAERDCRRHKRPRRLTPAAAGRAAATIAEMAWPTSRRIGRSSPPRSPSQWLTRTCHKGPSKHPRRRHDARDIGGYLNIGRRGATADPDYGVDEGDIEESGEYPDQGAPRRLGRPAPDRSRLRPTRLGRIPRSSESQGPVWGGRPAHPDQGLPGGPIRPIKPGSPDNSLPPGTIVPPLPPDLDLDFSGKAYLSVNLIYQGQRHHHHIIVTIPATAPDTRRRGQCEPRLSGRRRPAAWAMMAHAAASTSSPPPAGVPAVVLPGQDLRRNRDDNLGCRTARSRPTSIRRARSSTCVNLPQAAAVAVAEGIFARDEIIPPSPAQTSTPEPPQSPPSDPPPPTE